MAPSSNTWLGLDLKAVVGIREEPIKYLQRHGDVSIAFTVEQILDVSLIGGGLGGVVLTETAVGQPWVKDYDAIEGEGPSRWAKRFDVTNWGLLGAYEGDQRIGGAVIAFDSADLHLLRGRRDLAVLWDLRVAPDHRRSGVGAALFRAVERWARQRRCRALDVETQNVNAGACCFYHRMGCTLASIDRFAYPDLPAETQLLWRRQLGEDA